MIEDNVIQISLVVHYCYCPRRAWLESQGEKIDSFQMQSGLSAHHRTDSQLSRGPDENSSIEIYCKRLGISGKTDVVKMESQGLCIREYKSTPVRNKAVVTEGNRVQLALQTLCLREMGNSVISTEIYFTNHNQIVPVYLTEKDFACAERLVQETRTLILSTSAPEALEDDVRCSFCSHVDLCLPDEKYLKPVTRSIISKRNDLRVIYLTTPGAYVHLKKGRMLVEKEDEPVAEIPLETIQAVQVHGNVNLSGGLIKELMQRDIPLQWCTTSGRLLGWTVSSSGPNGSTRLEQHVLSNQGSLQLSREFIAAKIANQTTQLRRSGTQPDVVSALRTLQHRCDGVHDNEELLGLEGRAADLYFSHWPDLITEEQRPSWTWEGRSGRPAHDAINSMLNYAYALLLADSVKAIISCGLDPHAGFLHSSSRNKPALALDLMEEFRAPVADSVVQTCINCQIVKPTDFVDVLGSVRMDQGARRQLISTYERRMATEFMHPTFKYRVTWHRALEIQARQILGFIEHSQTKYQGIHVR